jgi:hypothetical protein
MKKVISIPLEKLVILNLHENIKIRRRASHQTRVTSTARAQSRAIIYAFRDANLDGSGFPYAPLASTGSAGIFDRHARSAAFWTSPSNAYKALVGSNLSNASTSWAHYFT